MKSYNVALPYIGPRSNFEAFRQHVEPSMWERLVITDSSPDSHLREFGLEAQGARVHYAPQNDGISRGWNRALREGLDLTIICSCSMRFPNGGMKAALLRLVEAANDFGVDANHAAHLLGVGRGAVETVGSFDENFYPAYFEDCDYWYRAHLAGWHHRTSGVRLPKIDVGAECVGDAVALRAGLLKYNEGGKLLDYYKRKWGGENGQEVFEHPFNDPTKPLSYWPGSP